ncbi:MAG: VCBS repeat-containing protein [Pirellulaceae bacterium]
MKTILLLISSVAALVLITTTCLAEAPSIPTFSDKPIWVSGSTYSGGDGNARLLDVDNDGDLDLITSVPKPRRWAVYRNENGKLASKPQWESLETTDCDHISVLDFNKDGRDDIAGTHESHCSLYINGTGKGEAPFGMSPTWETGTYIDANQIDFGDCDNDGDYDMLMAAGLPHLGLALFVNENGFPSKTVSRRIGPRQYSESAIFADIDSDGDQDIVGTYPKTGTIIVFANKGGGDFDEGTLVYKDQMVRHVQRVYCVDIDNDGSKELFCAKGPWGPPGRSVGLSRQDGSKTMKVVWTSGSRTGYHGFDFRDVDNDGDLDMAAADWGARRVSIYLQDKGVLSNKPVWSAPTTGPAHEAVFGDIDGDGDLDLVVGCLDQAMLFENTSAK